MKIRLADMRQDQVLGMGHAQIVEAVTLGEVGDNVDMVGRQVAGNAADRLEADVGDGVAGLLVRLDVLRHPDREIGVGQVDLVAQPGLECRRGEIGRDPLELGHRRVIVERRHFRPFLLDLAGQLFDAEVVDEDLDPRLVDVVAPARSGSTP